MLLLNNLTEEFFSDYPNEFGFIKRHLAEYGKIPDRVSFLDKFPDFELIEVTEPTSYLLTELYKDRNTRFLAKTFNTIRKLIGEGKIEEAMSLYSTASTDLATAIPMETVDLLSDTSRYDDYVEKCNDFSRYYVRTGFSELDDLIGGWDRNEELATIAARPGIGKSWILLMVAKAALEQGLRVGIYSGEMSERKVGYRFDTLASHISNSALTRGREHVKNDYREYISTLGDKYKGCLKVLTPSMISGPAGVNSLRAFIEKENLDILCVDQHSLLEDDRNARNPVERAANISKDLKNLQVMKKIPIIAVSQQNRASTETGVGTANIAQSDRISQDSTVILFLEQKDNILTMTLAKARDATNNKKLHYAADFDKGVFQYMPSEDDNPSSCEELREEYDGVNVDGDDVF
jgi:replicative DNA helicase